MDFSPLTNAQILEHITLCIKELKNRDENNVHIQGELQAKVTAFLDRETELDTTAFIGCRELYLRFRDQEFNISEREFQRHFTRATHNFSDRIIRGSKGSYRIYKGIKFKNN